MLLCIFDSYEKDGLEASIDYLASKFELRKITFDSQDSTIDILSSSKEQTLDLISKIKPDIILTNSLSLIPILIKNKLLVWFTDRSGGPCSKRQDQITLWRQTMGLMKKVDQVYVSSYYMAKAFMQNYRVSCKVQYPYFPNYFINDPKTIYYNEKPLYLHKFEEFAPNETFKKLEDYSELQNAKLYLHSITCMEYSNIELPIASSYGVPCIVENFGCLPEYISSGDKAITIGADEKQWVQTFKEAIRDRDINSKLTKQASFRYNQMSEIEDRIRQSIKKTLGKRVHPGQPIPKPQPVLRPPKEVIVKKQPIRQAPVVRGISPTHIAAIKEFLIANDNIYFGCGGLGDAILTIACCYYNPDAKVIFGQNHEGVRSLFDAFKIPVLAVPNFFPSAFGITIYNQIINNAHFKSAAHIPNMINYGDWLTNSDFYLSKIPKTIPLVERFGKLVNPRATTGIVGVAPRGSDHLGAHKQRFLSVGEFNTLVRCFLDKDKTVIAFGSSLDVNHYGVYPDNNFIWMTSEFGVSHPAPKYPMNMRHLLSTVNACDEIISVDTWLKTYSTLASIPTKVIKSRKAGVWSNPPHDASDYIFMNKAHWNMDFVTLDDLIGVK